MTANEKKTHCSALSLESNQTPVAVFEEGAPLSSEPWCLQNHDSPDQQSPVLFQIKDKQKLEIWREGLVEEHHMLKSLLLHVKTC